MIIHFINACENTEIPKYIFLNKQPKIETILAFPQHQELANYLVINSQFASYSVFEYPGLEAIHDGVSQIKLPDDKKSKLKAMLFWLKEQAKQNILEEQLKYAILVTSEDMNIILTELTNLENYDQQNQLFEFKPNAVTQICFSKTKECSIDFINFHI